ncbi:MAG: hypothetical protein QM811_12910 [Pirellulales bacterium]
MQRTTFAPAAWHLPITSFKPAVNLSGVVPLAGSFSPCQTSLMPM